MKDGLAGWQGLFNMSKAAIRRRQAIVALPALVESLALQLLYLQQRLDKATVRQALTKTPSKLFGS